MNEAGGHRIQRVPPTERKGRVHTSTVTVAVLDPMAQAPKLNEKDLKIEWYSGSGAGGQHRNKHQNSCRIVHLPSGITRKAETRHRQSSFNEALSGLSKAVVESFRTRVFGETGSVRRDQLGSGQRGDKRRTYRFQDNTVVDHITGRKSRCTDLMAGKFENVW